MMLDKVPAPRNDRTATWQGGSGRVYAALAENRDSFLLDDESLYVLVEAGMASWIGTARDLIEDGSSRARFRRVVNRAAAVLKLDCPADDVERMCLVYDIDAGRQLTRRDAA